MPVYIIGFALFSIIAVVLLADLIPILADWLSRIGIGRYDDQDLWNKSITEKGVRWLNKTPKIKITDNTRLIVIDMLRGKYSSSTIQHWQEAALVLGLAEYVKYNDDKKIKHKIIKFLDSRFDKTGQWKDKPRYVDGAILAYSVMKLEFIDTEKYKKALDFTWEMIREHIGDDGTVQYRKTVENYRYVDTIGFVCPFLVTYGIRYNNHQCIELAVRQIRDFEKNGMSDKLYIPCHAYRLNDDVPLGLFGWGRGFGWFATGLIDSWNELPEYHKDKPILEQIVIKLAKAVKACQQENGSWNWTVTRAESRPDSSATATLGWFMLNAAGINEISKECLLSADKALSYLMKVTRKNGAVDFSQGDTKDVGIYSMLFNILPFTQGFSIRMVNFSAFLRRSNHDIS